MGRGKKFGLLLIPAIFLGVLPRAARSAPTAADSGGSPPQPSADYPADLYRENAVHAVELQVKSLGGVRNWPPGDKRWDALLENLYPSELAELRNRIPYVPERFVDTPGPSQAAASGGAGGAQGPGSAAAVPAPGRSQGAGSPGPTEPPPAQRPAALPLDQARQWNAAQAAEYAATAPPDRVAALIRDLSGGSPLNAPSGAPSNGPGDNGVLQRLIETYYERNPQDPLANYFKGAMELKSSDIPNAVRHLGFAVTHNQQDADTLAAYASALYGSKDYPGAAQAARMSLEQDPGNRLAQAVLGFARNKGASDGTSSVAGALSALQGGAGGAPSGAGAPAGSGGSAAAPRGSGGLDMSGAAGGRSAGLAHDAEAKLQVRDFGAAADLATRAIQADPDNARAYNARATAFNRLGRYQQALSDAGRALRRFPNSPGALINRAWAFNRIRRYALARQDARRVLTPGRKDVDTAAAIAGWLMTAYAEAGLGRRAEMAQSLRNAATLAPAYQEMARRAAQTPDSQDVMYLFDRFEAPALPESSDGVRPGGEASAAARGDGRASPGAGGRGSRGLAAVLAAVLAAALLAGAARLAWDRRSPSGSAADVDFEKLRRIDVLAQVPGLKEALRGHDAVVDRVAARLQQNLSLASPHRTLGAFLLVGPTGTGKTYLGELMAKALYPDAEPVILRMNEYKDHRDVTTLLGPPPGYPGFEAGGALTRSVLENPLRVVIFDEFEKSHPDVRHCLYDVLDRARCVEKSSGRAVSFGACAFFATCNAGVESLRAIWAGTPEALRRSGRAREALSREGFDKALLARFDDVLFMDRLSPVAVAEVACLQLARHWSGYGLELSYASPEVLVEAVKRNAEFKEYGVRQLSRLIQELAAPSIEAARRSGATRVRLGLDAAGRITAAAA